MAQYNSASCNKIIRKLKDEYKSILQEERDNRMYTVGGDEDNFTCVPEYDFAETQEKLDAITEKIRKLRHAVNMFNTTYVLPTIGITIDEALYVMAVMNERKNTLLSMSRVQPKQRRSGYSGVEYVYTNYDVPEVKTVYSILDKNLSDIQMALDLANLTETFEVDI